MAKQTKGPGKDSEKAIGEGWHLVDMHPLFGRLAGFGWAADLREPVPPFPKDGWLRVVVSETRMQSRSRVEYSYRVFANARMRATAAEWANVFAQARLHLAMSHMDPARTDLYWRIACEFQAIELLRAVGIGTRPADLAYPDQAPPGRTLEATARALELEGPEAAARYGHNGLAGAGYPTWVFDGRPPPLDARKRREHEGMLAAAIRASVVAAVEAAGSLARASRNPRRNPNSLAERARSWFVASYPLLAALAAVFEIVEDEQLCDRLDIRIAAVEPEMRRIYVNPRFPWTAETMQFVIAHELLHVGLAHFARRQGRDPYVWNVACDYVINGWLVEMGVGQLPTDTLLFDETLGFEKESAEAIYDRIVRDMRLMRRLGRFVTLRGTGKPDMLGDRPAGWWQGAGCDLDSFYRRALQDGLDLHIASGRGLLPGDLVEEVRALRHPPIPWDVQLGQWLDAFFPPIERRRSFARASRRQASTPAIPRPVWVRPPELVASRTFGVVLDTSGSMPPSLIARALGAIASYAMSREVPLVRVLQCDARVHDMGYVEPERLLEQVEVRGRGGTVLMPAIVRLQQAADFPKDAPILVITDGECDALAVARDHAYLVPAGQRLPFRSTAPVFHFETPE